MKIYSYIVLLLFISSCNGGSKSNNDIYVSLSSENQTAIDFFRMAEEHRVNLEQLEAKEDYLSALRLDPNMVVALTEINEQNLQIKKNYIKKAISNLNRSNEFERLYFVWDTLSNQGNQREKKLEVAKKIIDLYPQNIDGYIMKGQSYNSWFIPHEKDCVSSFNQALEIDPMNVKASIGQLNCKYGGSARTVTLKLNLDFFNKFELDANAILSKFPNSFPVNLNIANKYRDSYNFIDQERLEKAKNLYEKCIQIADKRGSSSKILAIKNIARLNLDVGELQKSIEFYRTAIKMSENKTQFMTSNFDIFMAYIYQNDFLGAIRAIEAFNKDIGSFNFTKEEKLKCLVGLEYYKSLIYGHANQKDRALESLKNYKINSNNLMDYYGFDKNQKNLNQVIGNISGPDRIRWKELTTQRQLNNEIWVNILIGNYDEAENLLIKQKETYGSISTGWYGVLNLMKGNSEKAYNILKSGNFAYFQYFKAQALISLGEKDKAKSVLDSVRQTSGMNFFNGFIIKRAAKLYETL
jgi:tetratricopeptide (TPR) repeat protein